jgi:microcystin-dependent protein
MVADTYDSVLGLLLQGTGNNNNNWGNDLNNSSLSPAAQAIAGVNTIANTSGTVDLSTTLPPAGLRLDIAKIQLANGTLTGDLTVKVPNISKTTEFWNQTTGAFNMFVMVPGGAARTGPNAPGGLVQIPQGACIKVTCDGNGNLMRDDDKDVGHLCISGGAFSGPGELACNGASLLKAEFPDLYGKIGTTWGSADSLHFTLPLLTDTNRYLRAGGGSGPAVGTYQSNQNASHTHTQATGTISGATDSQGAHVHTASSVDSGHSHTYVEPTYVPTMASGGFVTSEGDTTANTGVGFANITTTIQSAGAHTHNVSGSASITLNSQGGAEARPESAAVLICIRY